MASEREQRVVSEGPLKILHQINVSSDILCCSLSETNFVATGAADGVIRVFTTESGTLVYKLPAPDKSYGPVTSVNFKKTRPGEDRTNILLATYGGGFICHWHVTSSQCLNTIKEDRQTLGAAFSPDGLHFSAVGSDAFVRVYNEATHQLMHCLQASPDKRLMDGHQMRVFTVKYHPSNPKVILSAGWDDTVQFWDLEALHSIRHISNVHVCGDAVDINSQDNNIVVGSWRTTDSLQIYDFMSCKPIKTFSLGRGKSSQLYCAKWLDQGMIACGGGSQNIAKILERQCGQNQARVTRLQHAVYSQDYTISRSNRRLYVITSGSTLFIFQHNFSGLIDIGEE